MTEDSSNSRASDPDPAESSNQTPPFLVAAVGASAGGLEAFSRLLRRLPGDASLALVLVQHLARDQHSMLPDILARRTELKVDEARDEMRIEAGHVYIIPSGAHMTVEDGHLRVKPRPAGSGGVQVDLLFRSFAEHYGEKAVGVVLSGGAHDGAAGLREIKGVGGITIAQSPEDAQIDGMPRAAIATGAADLVLPMDEIADELLRLSGLPPFRPSASEESADGSRFEGTYAAIFRLLRRGTGVDFNHYKRPTIERRIARRMTLRHATTLDSYLGILQTDPDEIQNLQEDVLIHVTSFFREPESFDALRETTFPAMLEERGDGPIRIWVPGCSTGEEVYSLAIALFESLEEEAEIVPIQFFGTDVSKVSIERARAGFYNEGALTDMSPERQRRFFSKIDGGYQIGKAIRERCVFARQDITRDPPFSKLDLIVCRNTLIYLGQPIQRRIIAMMHYALKPSGFLMLGRAETTGAAGELFATFDKRAKIYRKKPSASAPEFDFRAAPFEPSRLNASLELKAQITPRVSRPWDMQTEANRLLLERYAPAGILVDSSFRIVSARGQTAPFLELPSGEASLDALKMIKQGLLSALRSALQEARHSRSIVRKEGLQTLEENHRHPIDIEVIPVGSAESPHFFVSFSRAANPERGVDDSPRDPAHEGMVDDGLGQLRRELAATRDQLHANIHDLAAANEELQSANEEILSSNEELQSTNEELDTAKEELQSTNEELSTLNDELHGRNEELSLANSDLANLLASVQIPIVMVASDLTIRRFTPAAQRLLNLIPSDVGRPIGHIKPNLRAVDLEKPIADVIDTMVAFEQEAEDEAGRAYLLRIRPYKSVENRVDGAVLALFDISATKEALSIAKRTNDAVISTVSEPILVLDSELRVTRVNSAFCGTFALTPEQAENRRLHEVGDGAWDIPELRRMLDEVLPERKSFESFAVEHDFPKVGRKRLLLDGRRVEGGKSGAGVILLVIRELTNGAA